LETLTPTTYAEEKAMFARIFGCGRWFAVTVAVCWAIPSASAVAQAPSEPSSYQVVSGKIRVNGKNVAPGFVIAKGDTVETAKGSSAVVSLGKLGRVEVLPESKMKVTFDATSMTVEVDAGSVRVSKAEGGTTATVSTRDGEVVAVTPLAASFTVDTDCGNTVVMAHDAVVELHSSGGVKAVQPGSLASVGKARRGCRHKLPKGVSGQ
jgi:ferric-dicitrate binding protein FerR (iron transport regulator)